jgi:hypothetical protein
MRLTSVEAEGEVPGQKTISRPAMGIMAILLTCSNQPEGRMGIESCRIRSVLADHNPNQEPSQKAVSLCSH